MNDIGDMLVDNEAYKKGVKDANKRIESLIREIHDLVAKQAYQQARAEVVNELLTIENPCDNCYMEFCESCKHNGEYSFKIREKLELMRQKNE